MTFLAKMRIEETEKAHGRVGEYAVDYAGILAFHALHDKCGFGRERLARLSRLFLDLEGEKQGFAVEWARDLEDNGMNRLKLETISRKLGTFVAKTLKSREHEKWSIMVTMAAFVAVFHTLRYKFKFSINKINMLIDAISDAVYAVTKGDVHIVEFMECLDIECDVQCDVLDDWRKDYPGPIKIYGDYGKKWYRFKEETV